MQSSLLEIFNAYPIGSVLDDIAAHLIDHDEIVVEAPPGAGKSTLLPLALLEAPWLHNKKIAILQPRRMAARSTAERMASLLNEKVGMRVGYKIRQDVKLSEQTQIVVMTEGVLTRQLQQDPGLEEFALVIFDEFHERNMESDLALALSLYGRTLFREGPNLKLLVMSATLDGLDIASLLDDAHIIKSEGRSHPVEVYYEETTIQQRDVINTTYLAIQKCLAKHNGDVLVFLPGIGEIRTLQTKLESTDAIVYPLHGGLTLNEQHEALAPKTISGKRKIVLSTDIAETSLTIEGIECVVDSGLGRAPKFDPNSALTRLHTRRISKASATQRMGRAGRLKPGHCYRVWSQEQQKNLAEQFPAEILSADLAPLLLQMLQWGVSNPHELTWLDSPNHGNFQQAKSLLENLGAIKHINNDIVLTDHGTYMGKLPCHPRIAHMLVLGCRFGLIQSASNIAGLLSERDPLSHMGGDIELRLEIIEGSIQCPNSHKAWQSRVIKQSKSYANLCRQLDIPITEKLDTSQACAFLLASAFPDRISKRHKTNQFKMANGRLASISNEDPLSTALWLIIVDSGGKSEYAVDRIYLASYFDVSLLDDKLAALVSEKSDAGWDFHSGRFIAEKKLLVGKLVINTVKDKQHTQSDKINALLKHIQQSALSVLPWTKDMRQLKARITLFRKFYDAPSLETDALTQSLDVWLAPYLTHINHLDELQNIDLKSALRAMLSWELQSKLDELVPEKIRVPSGSYININYEQASPVLSVKLQEMFGCEQTPTILNGRVALTLHLLSPAKRPLQITQDLSAFWQNSYSEVKKEMRGRYPKHPWPDDPLTFIPTAKTKKKLRNL